MSFPLFFTTTRNRFYIENQDTTVCMYNQESFEKISLTGVPNSAVVRIQALSLLGQDSVPLRGSKNLFSTCGTVALPTKTNQKKKEKKPTYLY